MLTTDTDQLRGRRIQASEPRCPTCDPYGHAVGHTLLSTRQRLLLPSAASLNHRNQQCYCRGLWLQGVRLSRSYSSSSGSLRELHWLTQRDHLHKWPISLHRRERRLPTTRLRQARSLWIDRLSSQQPSPTPIMSRVRRRHLNRPHPCQRHDSQRRPHHRLHHPRRVQNPSHLLRRRGLHFLLPHGSGPDRPPHPGTVPGTAV